jgi:biotin synthase
MDARVVDIAEKVLDGGLPNREEVRVLVEVLPHSAEAGYVMAMADAVTRSASGNAAEVHAQIGLNASPCSNNCQFCPFAAVNGILTDHAELPVEEAVEVSVQAERDGANALFPMVTGDYPFGKFSEVSQEIRRHLRPETVMIANVGDFGPDEGQRLKEAGYSGIYHTVRLGEGVVTQIAPERRLATIQAAREAGLLIGTCIEPVGPEHSTHEVVESILLAREMQPCYSGAMRRMPVAGSSLEKFGTISEYRMAYLVAVVRLAMGVHVIGNCTHEPNLLGATTGANLFWAEAGMGPRDAEEETPQGRRRDVGACQGIFREAEYEVLTGPSVIYGASDEA